METLSDRQQNVLDFIMAHINQYARPPTYREIGDALGIASTNGVADHIKALIRKGYLTQPAAAKGASRSLKLTSKARSERRGHMASLLIHAEDGSVLGTTMVHRKLLPANRVASGICLPRRSIVSEAGDVLVFAELTQPPRPGQCILVYDPVDEGYDVVLWRAWHTKTVYEPRGQVYLAIRQVTRASPLLDLGDFQRSELDDELEEAATAPHGVESKDLQGMLRGAAPRYTGGANLARNKHMHNWRGSEPTLHQLQQAVGAFISTIPSQKVGSAIELADTLIRAVKHFKTETPMESAIVVDYANWAAREHGGVDLALYESDKAA